MRLSWRMKCFCRVWTKESVLYFPHDVLPLFVLNRKGWIIHIPFSLIGMGTWMGIIRGEISTFPVLCSLATLQGCLAIRGQLCYFIILYKMGNNWIVTLDRLLWIIGIHCCRVPAWNVMSLAGGNINVYAIIHDWDVGLGIDGRFSSGEGRNKTDSPALPSPLSCCIILQ